MNMFLLVWINLFTCQKVQKKVHCTKTSCISVCLRESMPFHTSIAFSVFHDSVRVCAHLWMCVWAWLPPPHAMLALATMVQRGWGWGQPQPEYWMGHVIHELKSLCPFLSFVCPPLQRPGAFSICLKRSRCRNPQWTRENEIHHNLQLARSN